MCGHRGSVFLGLLIASGLLVADLSAPLAQAAAAQASLDSDVINQVDGDNANHECTLANPCTGSNLILINPGITYWAGADELGSCQDATYQWSLQSANGTELFRVKNDGSGVLNGWTTGTIARIGSPGFRGRAFTLVQFSVSVTTSIKLVPMLGSGCNSFTTTGFAKVVFPPGVSNETQLIGYAGAWYVQCCVGQASGILLQQDTLLSENGIESTEATINAHVGNVIGTGFQAASTYQLLNSEQCLACNNSASGGAGVATDMVQSFTPNATLGTYVAHTTFLVSVPTAPSCSGTFSIAITTSDPTAGGAWNVSAELANITATMTKGTSSAAASTYIFADWVNGTISDSGSGIQYTTVVLSTGGQTGTPSAFLAPPIATAPKAYLRYFSSVTCSDGMSFIMPVLSGTDQYAGGTAFSRNAGSSAAYTTQTTDFQRFTVTTYGANAYAWSLPATPQNVGGSFHIYVYEVIKDTGPQQYSLSTSFGGTARVDNYQFATGTSTQQVACRSWYFIQKCANGQTTSCPDNSCAVIQEWRLGYAAPEWNAAQTWTLTLNAAASGRNQLYVAIINQVNQPAHLHVGSVTWTSLVGGSAPLQSYEFFSTDDYYANVHITVETCVDVNCAALGAAATGANYVVTICPGVFSRTIAGSVDPGGSFNVTGQDLPNCVLSVVLSGSAYATTSWTLSIATAGNYSYTLGILTPQSVSLQPTLAPATITFDGNLSRTIPDRVQVNITRSRSAALFVGADHVDPSTGIVEHNVVRATVWDAFSGNVFNFYYPTRIKSGPQDKGGYVLWVINDTGVVLGYTTFYLEPAGVSSSADAFTVTSDMLQGISKNGYSSALEAYQQVFQASISSQQKTVRDQVYEDFQKVHDYGIVFIVLLGVLAVVRAFRR